MRNGFVMVRTLLLGERGVRPICGFKPLADPVLPLVGIHEENIAFEL